MNHMDLYLRRAVRGAIALLEDEPEKETVLAYHLAVGLAMQPDGADHVSMSEIVKDGIWALHRTADRMASEGQILLEDYSNKHITTALVACERGITLVPGRS